MGKNKKPSSIGVGEIKKTFEKEGGLTRKEAQALLQEITKALRQGVRREAQEIHFLNQSREALKRLLQESNGVDPDEDYSGREKKKKKTKGFAQKPRRGETPRDIFLRKHSN